MIEIKNRYKLLQASKQGHLLQPKLNISKASLQWACREIACSWSKTSLKLVIVPLIAFLQSVTGTPLCWMSALVRPSIVWRVTLGAEEIPKVFSIFLLQVSSDSMVTLMQPLLMEVVFLKDSHGVNMSVNLRMLAFRKRFNTRLN